MSVLLSESDVDGALSMDAAIDAVDRGFRFLARGDAQNFPRRRGGPPGAVLNVMWAVAPTMGLMAVKSYPVVRTDVPQSSTSILVLYGLPDGRVRGLLEADTLGQRRTGAASAVATRALARPDSRVLAVFGAGWQAVAQVDALRRVLTELAHILVVNRDRDRARVFASSIEQNYGVSAEETDAESAVREADVIVTATGAQDPLFDGAWLRPGTHINAVGSNHSERAEIDATTVASAAVIAADSVEVARLECGDLHRAGIDWESVAELGDILEGRRPGRRSDNAVTIFESQGLAIEDLVCADVALREATSHAAGLALPI